MKKNIRLRVALLIALAFFSGGAVGFFAGQYIPPCFCSGKPGPPPSPDKIKNMLKHRFFDRLRLSEEQCRKAVPAIDRWYEQMEILRRVHAPDYQAVFTEFFDSLKPILTPEQNQELEKMRSEIRTQHFRHGKYDRGRPNRDPGPKTIVRTLSPEAREAVFRNMRKVMQQEMREWVKRFLQMNEAEQDKFIDRMIEEMKNRRLPSEAPDSRIGNNRGEEPQGKPQAIPEN